MVYLVWTTMGIGFMALYNARATLQRERKFILCAFKIEFIQNIHISFVTLIYWQRVICMIAYFVDIDNHDGTILCKNFIHIQSYTYATEEHLSVLSLWKSTFSSLLRRYWFISRVDHRITICNELSRLSLCEPNRVFITFYSWIKK